jgi:hypothetical protein
MPWWRVLLETWWWVLCGVALGAIGARVLLSRPPLPVETHPAFAALRSELAEREAMATTMRDRLDDAELDRRSLIGERDALVRQVHELEGELRQARRRLQGAGGRPEGDVSD